jgi:hypothetical protein
MPSLRLSDDGVERSPAIDEVQPAVASERLLLLAALDQRARRQIAGVLRARLERAEPAFVLAAGRPDASALVEGDGAVGKNARRLCRSMAGSSTTLVICAVS